MKQSTLRYQLFFSTFLLCISFPIAYGQDIGAILAIQEIDTMLYSGPKDNRINWVIQNRGDQFTDKDDFTTLYRNDLLKAFEPGHILAQEPYAQYRNFFNLYTFWWPDAPDDNTGWSFGIIQALRDSVFLPWADENTGWATFFSTNKYGGGGGAGLDREARVGDGKMYGMGWETFLHEFGHTMPGLLDEYSASGSWSNGQCWETPNTTGQLVLDEIPWRRWIKEGTPLPTPYTEAYVDQFGAFEGAMTNYFGCHRPTARGCFMGAGGFGEEYGQTLCSPCIQRVICFLYKYVHVIENPIPASDYIEVNGPETITFSVDVLKPEPNTQQTRWILNGKVIGSNTESIDVTFDACASYELVFEVNDTNTLVRYDPKFESTYPKPYQKKVWTINQAQVNEYSLSGVAETVKADCNGQATGMVDFTISGGLPPYGVYLDGAQVSNPVTDLSAGEYRFDIVDALGCRVINEIDLDAEPLLDPQICTIPENGSWTLSVMDATYNNEDLAFLWSTLETGPSIQVVADGTYFVDITTATGCTIRKSIDVSFAENSPMVHATTFPTGLDKPTGKIYLDIDQGRAPYTIEWAEKINRDLTDTATANILSSGTTWGHEPQFAFDNSLSTKWLHAVSGNAFIGYYFQEPQVVTYYVITSADDVPERDPKDWEFQGSADGTDWITLDQQAGQSFGNRFERRGFVFANAIAYPYYRLLINQNHGDIATQIQELEIIGADSKDTFTPNGLFYNQAFRSGLKAGLYRFMVKDANATAYVDSVYIGYTNSFLAPDLVVVQEGDCRVVIESPAPGMAYYWFPDQEATSILDIGTSFQPQKSGNYYVGAVDILTGAISSNVKGFAVTVGEIPEVEVVSDTILQIVNSNPEYIYQWYDQDQCGDPVQVGDTFVPPIAGTYYVSAKRYIEPVNPINPGTIDGLIIRMDAADLNGDEIIDNPPPPTSSVYGWTFSNGNSWADNNWYAFRSNYQNGLGIADFATIWLQRITAAENNYQTILLAYEENPLSFPGRAPFEGLSVNIPRHTDASQLYSDSAPDRTLNGTTYLNGNVVDPLHTANPMDFCILGTVMTETAGNEIFYTDTHWEGKIGELILYDRALTPEEMQGASEFLRKKWISLADLESPRQTLHWDGIVLDVDAEPIDKDDITLYPNPTSGLFYIQGLEGRFAVEILDRSGRAVRSFPVVSDYFNIETLPAGMYFVKMISEDKSRVVVTSIIKL